MLELLVWGLYDIDIIDQLTLLSRQQYDRNENYYYIEKLELSWYHHFDFKYYKLTWTEKRDWKKDIGFYTKHIIVNLSPS